MSILLLIGASLGAYYLYSKSQLNEAAPDTEQQRAANRAALLQANGNTLLPIVKPALQTITQIKPVAILPDPEPLPVVTSNTAAAAPLAIIPEQQQQQQQPATITTANLLTARPLARANDLTTDQTNLF